jgi:methyl-accepting chemotaxis protein
MTKRERSVMSELDRRTHAFEQRFLRVVTTGLTAAGLSALVAFLAAGAGSREIVVLGLVCLATGAALAATFFADDRGWAAAILLFGTAAAAGIGLSLDGRGVLGIGAIEGLLVSAVLAPFLLSPRLVLVLVIVEIGLVLSSHLWLLWGGVPALVVLAPALGTSATIATASGSISYFVRHAAENQATLRQRLADIDVVVERAERIAEGDLSGSVSGDGEAPRVIGEMLKGLRGLVSEVQSNAAEVSAASREIAAMAQQQERSAIEQSSAIEETRRTVNGLLESARQIASSAHGVAENAEATLANAGLIHERIRTLTMHAERITEVLEFIRDVANKSELLALNAALEGAKAGEAGRGFSLVASQMQRLAESVMEAVKTVRELTADIRKSTQATALATEDATKLAGDTTAAAKRIGVITGEQQASTEQVTRAIDEIADATRQAAAGTNQTLQAVRDLAQVATRLDGYASRFQL